MSANVNIVEVSPENIGRHPQAICFTSTKHACYRRKIDWLGEQFDKGLKIKLLYLKGEKRPAGFIEYVPGEHCWRPVDARGYMFIHCIWTNGRMHRNRGFGTLLIEEAERDAAGMSGVCVVASDGPFMADCGIFSKNGYTEVSRSGKERLLVKRFAEGPTPSIRNWRRELERRRGFQIVYSRQCPWVARFIEEVKPILAKYDLKPQITELETAARAQAAPSLYGVFSLIHDGRLLADRYISTTRFLNILKKERIV